MLILLSAVYKLWTKQKLLFDERKQKTVRYHGVGLKNKKETWFIVLHVNKKMTLTYFTIIMFESTISAEFNLVWPPALFCFYTKTTHLKYRMWPLNGTVLLYSLRQTDEACPCSRVGSYMTHRQTLAVSRPVWEWHSVKQSVPLAAVHISLFCLGLCVCMCAF